MTSKDHEEIVELMRQQINATDRTTHAVRAIVLPSTIILLALLIGLPLVLIEVFAGDGSGFFGVIGGLVLLVGVVLAIAAQISETNLSEIPGTYITDVTPISPSSSTPESDSEVRSKDRPADSNTRKCSSCGAYFPKTRMVCPECGMN